MSDNDQKDKGIETDVPGIKSDDVMTIGKDKYPVFNVEPDDFWKNVRADRRRLSFKKGSKVQQFHQQTRYRAPFWIRTTDKTGRVYTRKIK